MQGNKWYKMKGKREELQHVITASFPVRFHSFRERMEGELTGSWLDAPLIDPHDACARVYLKFSQMWLVLKISLQPMTLCVYIWIFFFCGRDANHYSSYTDLKTLDKTCIAANHGFLLNYTHTHTEIRVVHPEVQIELPANLPLRSVICNLLKTFTVCPHHRD